MAMTLRLDDRHDAMLTDLANSLGCSKQQAVIHALELADERIRIHNKALVRVQEILETRDKELMDRLADA